MVDWSKLPDLAAFALLAVAFATVAQRSRNHTYKLWLIGWLMIVLHFAAFLFAPINGFIGDAAAFVGLSSIVWAGELFLWATIPHKRERSSRALLASLLITNTLYIGLLVWAPNATWALMAAAVLLGTVPLAVATRAAQHDRYPLRWTGILLYVALGMFLLAFPKNSDLDLNALFFTVYFGCCLYFWYAYRRLATGAFVTTAGFLAWAMVFVAAPGMGIYLPSFRLESEVWNLPKYVVAVGMILLMLEEQIEHNKHLALHDELTGLPNRRLFQDRLNNALERARRSGSRVALLLIDLDRFKQVNDTIGHHIGDLVLKRAGQIFQGRVRRSDTVARSGGDEFSIILEDPVTREDAERVAFSLIELLRQPLELQGHTVTVGASVGIAVFPDDAPDGDALRIAADLRMYARKFESRRKYFHSTESALREASSVVGSQTSV